METTAVSFSGQMDKEAVVCMYNGVLFSRKTEWKLDISYNMNRLQKYCARWSKPEKDK